MTQTVEEQQQIVTFEADKAVVAEHQPGEVQVPSYGAIQHTDAMTHSVVSFLGRPQLISSFPWSVNASRSENILPSSLNDGKLYIPTSILTTQYRNKLDGFTSIRATAVIKLQVNAQPFQAGRLLMAAAPMPTILGNRKEFLFKQVGTAQCVNHVQMDIAKQTEVELRIPFISPYNSFDLIDGKFDWAEVRVLVYSPLNSIDKSALQCVLWAHFEDIELGAPTSGQIIAKQQSGQVSAQKVKQQRMQESKGENVGTLSKIGSTIGGGFDSVVSGISNITSGVSALFGWSKPIISKPGCSVLERPTESFGNVDGVDHSLVLAMSAGNAVDYYPRLTGTDIDELSFDYLKRVPQFISVFSYSNSSQYNSKLWDCAVSPSCNIPACYYIKPESDGDVKDPYTLVWKQPTTLNYITSPFLYWTGSLVYTFRFVKTDYHSGRVEVSYHPFVNSVDTSRMDYVYKAVVDLRENSEVSITVPYISPQPWKRISTYLDPVNPDPPTPGRRKDVITGILYVRALTPLICANSIIANTIEVLVEVRAGDDFMVQAPVANKFLPFSFQNAVATQQSGNLRKSLAAVTGNTVVSGSTVYGLTVSASTMTNSISVTGGSGYSLFDGSLRLCYSSQPNDNTQSTIVLAFSGGISMNLPFYAQKSSFGVVTDIVFPIKFYFRDGFTMTLTKTTNDSLTGLFFGSVVRMTDYGINDGSPVIVRITDEQLPLPIASEGSGICSTVKIDSSSLPIWVTQYSRATATQQSGGFGGAIKKLMGTAGTVETRTHATEGWMPPSITGNDSDIHRPDTSQLCAGEVFASLRPLTRRFAYFLANGISSGNNLTINPAELVKPGALYLRANGVADTPTKYALYAPISKSEVSSSPLNFVAGMYAFWRGSLRFKAWCDPRDASVDLLSMNLEYSRQTQDANTTVGLIENYMTPIGYELPKMKQFGEWQVPYYSPTVTSALWSHPNDNQFDTPLVNAVIGVPSNIGDAGAKKPIKVAIAGGDDLDFQVFIGPPPVVNITELNGSGSERVFHYPEGGFTPTQNIDLKETPVADISVKFVQVKLGDLRVVNNAKGMSCARDPPTTRRRAAPVPGPEDTLKSEIIKSNPKFTERQVNEGTVSYSNPPTAEAMGDYNAALEDYYRKYPDARPKRSGGSSKPRGKRELEDGYDTVE